MDIKGKVHCFFEQSGTFKREFIKLGIPAEDYDIQNNFGETDHTDDLFKEIEDAYDNKESLFDNIKPDDLIIAFFPCIYFCATSQMAFFWTYVNYRKKTIKEATDLILQRTKDREKFYSLAVKMLAVANIRGLRLIMENPWSEQTYLKANFVKPPTLVDMDRTKRGDYYTKPTAYWFINCEPTNGHSFQRPKEHKTILSSKGGARAGLCSEDRSMISPDYARNFICDFILGKKQQNSQLDLFDTFCILCCPNEPYMIALFQHLSAEVGYTPMICILTSRHVVHALIWCVQLIYGAIPAIARLNLHARKKFAP